MSRVTQRTCERCLAAARRQQQRTTAALVGRSGCALNSFTRIREAPTYHTTTRRNIWQPHQTRLASTASPGPIASTSSLSDKEYHEVADEAMTSLTDYFEELIEDVGDDLRGSDVDYSAGVLTLRMGDDSYVINKQPPNKQIWLSSPKSGPKRYDYNAQSKEWFYSRDGSLLRDLLNTELSDLLHRRVSVDIGGS